MKKLFIIAIAALLGACTQIDTGNVGVEATLGQVKPDVLPPGVYITPIKKVVEVSAKELPLQLNDMKPQTKDKITLADLDIDVYIQINPSKAPSILTRWPGDMVELKGEEGMRIGFNYVTRQAREAVYDVVTKYGSDVVHTKRAEIAAETLKSLQANLDKEAGDGWFFVRSVNVRNLVTDPALEAAIKESANRDYQIRAKQKEVELARAEAERKREEAKGEADAIRLRATALMAQGGDDYVRLKAIEKWDGKLPVTNAGGAMPMLNLK